MYTLRIVLTVLFVIDSILLVIAVLLQSGRGGGLAGALGGIGSADSALGVRAASTIEKATGIMAGIFLLLALTLSLMSGGGTAISEETPIEERGTGVQAATTPPAGTEIMTNGATTEPATGGDMQPASTEPAAATTDSAGATTPAATVDATEPATTDSP